LGDCIGERTVGESAFGEAFGDKPFGDFTTDAYVSGVTLSELLPARCTFPASVVIGEMTNSTV